MQLGGPENTRLIFSAIPSGVVRAPSPLLAPVRTNKAILYFLSFHCPGIPAFSWDQAARWLDAHGPEGVRRGSGGGLECFALRVQCVDLPQAVEDVLVRRPLQHRRMSVPVANPKALSSVMTVANQS
eukprot:3839113-Pyramimonas_sp.AAC.1